MLADQFGYPKPNPAMFPPDQMEQPMQAGPDVPPELFPPQGASTLIPMLRQMFMPRPTRVAPLPERPVQMPMRSVLMRRPPAPPPPQGHGGESGLY